MDKLTVGILVNGINLKADLTIPAKTVGLVIFSHGSCRLSPRIRYVIETLVKNGLAILLFDLLTPIEDENYQKRFDIELLSSRLMGAFEWLKINLIFNIGHWGILEPAPGPHQR